MTIEQIVEIPDNRRLTIEVPREVPTGTVILTFTPAKTTAKAYEKSEARDIELINRNAERLNREALDVLSFQNLEIWKEATSTGSIGDLKMTQITHLQASTQTQKTKPYQNFYPTGKNSDSRNIARTSNTGSRLSAAYQQKVLQSPIRNISVHY